MYFKNIMMLILILIFCAAFDMLENWIDKWELLGKLHTTKKNWRPFSQKYQRLEGIHIQLPSQDTISTGSDLSIKKKYVDPYQQ